MNRANTPASLAQRRANCDVINKRRRESQTCSRGHSNWVVLKDGRRQCRTCKNDRQFYWKHGLSCPL